LVRDEWYNQDMGEDPRSDEDLVSACLGGDKSVLEILLTRYSTIILSYLLGLSLFTRDEAYLDDLRQEVLLIIWTKLRDGLFMPAGPGSFKRWVYKIAYFEALKQDKRRGKRAKPLSEVFPEEPTGIPDDLLIDLAPRVSDYEEAELKLPEMLSRLSEEEQRLMRLVSEGKPYKEIQQDPSFSRYSLDYLMRKVYIIRQRMRGKEDK